ncbi:MAG: hypothetical protein ACR2FG_05555 [Marmoricola sp.]
MAGRGTPEDFYLRPPTLAATRFFTVANEVPGRVSQGLFTADNPKIGPVPAGSATARPGRSGSRAVIPSSRPGYPVAGS